MEPEQIIVKYLLGQLSEQEQESVEQHFFRDESYHERLRAVEDDLIDDYVRGELEPLARSQFEHHFLVSTERKERVLFARALVETADQTLAAEVSHARAPQEPSPSWWSAFWASVRRPGLAWQGALALLLLCLLAGVIWMSIQSRRLDALRVAERNEAVRREEELRRRLAEQEERRVELERRAQEIGGEGAASASALDKLRGQLAESEEGARRLRDELARLKSVERGPGTGSSGDASSTPATLASFVLSPSTRDSSGPAALSVPQGARAINLRLKVASGDDYPGYRVALSGREGAPVWTSGRLRARGPDGNRTVNFNLPASLLAEGGSYELSLTGISQTGAAEVLSYYYFTLEKR